MFSVARILVSLSLFALLLWMVRENFAKIWHLLSSVNIFLFTLAFLTFISAVIFMAWRLKIVLAAQEAFFTISDLFPLTLIGYFFTNFMPTSVGGDLVKGYYISKKNKRRLTAYTSVFFDRVIGMLSVALIASFALVIMRKGIEHKFIIWAISFLLFGCVVFALFLFHSELLKKIANAAGITRLLQVLKLDSVSRKAYGALRVYANRKEIIVKALILSLVAQFISFFSIFILSKGLSAYIPFGKIILVLPVIFVLCMIPITMNGLGLREWAFVLFFSADIGDAAALSLSLLYLAMFLLTSLIGGIIYLFWR